MSRNLCISVTFLDPFFHGKGDDEPEWPPSPMRLFQALLAASRCGCHNPQWSDVKAEAFHWLERQPPPLIIAPPASPAAAYTLYVPNNDGDKKFERQDRLTTKITRPHRLQGGRTVHYAWPLKQDCDTDEGHAQELCRAARKLLALGWGIDQVVGNGRILSTAEVATLRGQRWRSWSIRRPGVQPWRVPAADALEDLERVHRSFLQRIEGPQYNPPLKFKEFNSVTYLHTDTLPPRPYAAFELPDGVAFRQEKANEVAAMLRSLGCKHAKEDTHEFPGGSETYVAGHVTDENGHTPPRFSYLPLPTIGHPHADGMIRRVLIAEPYGGSGWHARWAQERLRNAALRDTEGEYRGVLLDLWRPSSRRIVVQYVGEAQTWFSVTPIVLPGFDDGKQVKAERLFLSAVVQADIPLESLDALTLRKAPFWPRARHARHYAAPDYLRHLPRWHVWIRFREPVPGPLAIGAGRHAGLGLMVAVE